MGLVSEEIEVGDENFVSDRLKLVVLHVYSLQLKALNLLFVLLEMKGYPLYTLRLVGSHKILLNFHILTLEMEIDSETL